MLKTRFGKILLVSVVLLAVLAGGGYLAHRKYVSLRQTRLLKQARHYLAKAEGRKALLCLQRAVKANPNDLQACRLMAELTEAARSPSALLWRSRVVELAPKSVQDRLALARTALALRDYISATNALEGVSEAGKKTAAFHNIAGTAATVVNRLAEAEAHFLEASRLDATNPVPQLNLAVVRLQRTNAQAQAQARATLQQLRAHPLLCSQALRELAVDALRSQHTNDALALSAELLRQTNAVFGDRLLRLQVLHHTQNPTFQSTLAAFQREAAGDSAKIYELAMWQIQREGPTNALAWLKTLPPSTRTNQPVTMLLAQCQTALQDWRALQETLTPQNWAELEFVRHAFLTRALRGMDLVAAAKPEWDSAVKGVAGRKEGLVMLLRLAAGWNWLNEAEELLWSLVNNHPGEKWAVAALNQALTAGGRTRSLMTLCAQQLKLMPSNPGLKNNLAITALLLDAQEVKPHQLAREVYEQAPTNAAFASTYAFSLHRQDKNAEALKVMEGLPPRALEDPSIAAYYGLILKATGDKAKAKKYLSLAAPGSFLPEERKLIEQAKAGL